MNVPTVLETTRWRSRSAAGLFALLSALPSACVFDSSKQCGPHEIMYGNNLRCVCDATSAPTATGCSPCGEHELPGATGCVCQAGYSRPSAAAACIETPMGIGIACDASTPCPDPAFSHCQSVGGGSGYCTTTDCTGPQDCTAGYACDMTGSASYCRRPPLGAGMTCTSDADCAGTEATACDSVMSHTCLVQGCSLVSDDCFSGTACCDLSKFGAPQPLCLPEGACP